MKAPPTKTPTLNLPWLFSLAFALAGCQHQVGGVYTINQANDDPTATYFVVEDERRAEDAKKSAARKQEVESRLTPGAIEK